MGGALSEEAAAEIRLLRAAFRACPTVIFLTTGRGIIVDATDAAAQFLNVPVGLLLDKPLLHFVARGDTKRFRSFVNEGAREPISLRMRARHGPIHSVRLEVRSEMGRLIWLAHPEPASNASGVAAPPIA
jgi:PAS domain-containing protein